MSGRIARSARRSRSSAGLPPRPTALALYAALTDSGRRRDTFLLERSVGPSLLMDQAAVRIECRGREVVADRLVARAARKCSRRWHGAGRARVVVRSDDRADPALSRGRQATMPRNGCRAVAVRRAARHHRARYASRRRSPSPSPCVGSRRLRPCRPVRGLARQCGRGPARLSRFPLLAGRDADRVRGRRRAARCSAPPSGRTMPAEAERAYLQRRRSASPSWSSAAPAPMPLPPAPAPGDRFRGARRRPRRCGLWRGRQPRIARRISRRRRLPDRAVAHLPRALPRSAAVLRRAARARSQPLSVLRRRPGPRPVRRFAGDVGASVRSRTAPPRSRSSRSPARARAARPTTRTTGSRPRCGSIARRWPST